MVLTFGLLAAALLALWAPARLAIGGRLPMWMALACASLAAALAHGIVRPVGLLGIAAWFALAGAWARAEAGGPYFAWRWPLFAVVVAMAAALMLHRVPGFANPRVIDAVRFTPDALPFTLYLNFDKALIGLAVLAWAHPRIASIGEWRVVLSVVLRWIGPVIAVVLVAALAVGYVRWAPKLPPESWLWAGVNLLFVCLAEEALFRGVIQARLRRAWSHRRGGRVAALGIAALLFGVAHVAGGWAYVLLATIAGAGYGWVYERTQRVEASVLLHFGLNATHFFLFTYPALGAAG